jgi:hypothetical protein
MTGRTTPSNNGANRVRLKEDGTRSRLILRNGTPAGARDILVGRPAHCRCSMPVTVSASEFLGFSFESVQESSRNSMPIIATFYAQCERAFCRFCRLRDTKVRSARVHPVPLRGTACRPDLAYPPRKDGATKSSKTRTLAFVSRIRSSLSEATTENLPCAFCLELGVPEATDHMVVDHPCRLHESVADRRAHKSEPTLLQLFAHRV